MSDTVYKGYLIKQHPYSGEWTVSKSGFHIATYPTLAKAKAGIDEIASTDKSGRWS